MNKKNVARNNKRQQKVDEKRDKSSRFVENKFSLNSQADYVLSIIAREVDDHATKVRTMRNVAMAYGLDNGYVDDVLRGNVEHSGLEEKSGLPKSAAVSEGMAHLRTAFMEFARYNEGGKLVKNIEHVLTTCFLMFINRESKKAMYSLASLFVVNHIHSGDGTLTELVLQIFEAVTTGKLDYDADGNIEQSGLNKPGIVVEDNNSTMKRLTAFLRRPCVSHAKVVVSLLCTIGFIDAAKWTYGGFEVFTVNAFKSESTSFLDLLDMCLEATIYFINTGYACFSTLSLKPLFITSDLMYDLEMLVDKLDIDTTNYKIGCSTVDIDPSDLMSRCYKINDKMRTCFHNIKPIEKPVAIKLSKKLLRIEADIIATIQGQCVRVAPYCVKTYGRSGVGKTSFNNIVMYEVLRMNGFPFASTNIAKIEPTERFWNNVTNSTTGITIDDMANTKANKAKEDPVQLLIMLCNNQPQMVPRAEVNEKGTVFVQAKYVGVTTNHRTLAAEHWSVEPMSALRRCHLHIDLRVKSIYATRDGRLDPVKAASAPKNGYIQDLWDIDVFEIGLDKSSDTTHYEQYKFRPLYYNKQKLENCDIFTFLAFVKTHSEAYYANQNAMLSSQDVKMNVPCFCEKCLAPTEICFCPPANTDDGKEQSGALFVGASILSYMTSMTSILSFIGVLFLKNIWPHVVNDTSYKIISLFRIFFQPNYFERVVIQQFTNGARTHCTAASVQLFHRFIDFNMKILPDVIVNSHWATAFYMYMNRGKITYTWYDGHRTIVTVLCYVLSLFLWFDNMFKGLIITNVGFLNIGVQETYPWFYLVIYYSIFSVISVASLISQRSTNLLLQYISYKVIQAIENVQNIDNFIFWWLLYHVYCVASFGEMCMVLSCVVGSYGLLIGMILYMRTLQLYYKLQSLRCHNEKGKPFYKWDFPTFGQFRVNKNTSVGQIVNTANVITLISIVTLVRLGLGIYRELVVTREQGGVLSAKTVVEAEKRERQLNIWDNARSFVSLPGTFGVDGAISKLKKNLVSIVITQATISSGVIYPNTFCAGVIIKGKILFMPYHMMYHRHNRQWNEEYITFTMEIIRSNTKNGWREVIVGAKTQRIPNTDIVAVPTYGGGLFGDITNLFPDSTDYIGVTTTVTRVKTGEAVVNSSYIDRQHNYIRKTYQRNAIHMDWNGVYIHKDVSWSNGDCMSLTVSRTSQPRIVGMHLLGSVDTTDDKIGCSIVFTRNQIADFLSSLPLSFIAYTPAEIKANLHNTNIGFRPEVDKRSPVNFIEHSNISVLGSVGIGSTYKSKVRPSKAVPYLTQHLGPQKWGPPKFGGSTGREHWTPWYEHLKNVGMVATRVPDDVLQVALQDYIRPILPLMRMHGQKTKVLTELETVNGFEASRFLTGLNKKTSMGFPLGGIKEKHLCTVGISETGRTLHNFKPEVWAHWYEMEEQLLSGCIPTTIFKATLKDEPTKLDKTKVRVFQAADVVFQLGIRKYFLPIIRVLCLHPLVSECAVGINPFSLEWEALHNHVVLHGEANIVAGDYKSWDMLLPSKLVFNAMNALVDLVAITHLYDDRSIKIMRGICVMLSDPLIHLNGTLIRYHGSVPSGHNLTSTLNSICNSLLLRCCFYRHNSTCLDFRHYCTPITYGDDFMMGVNRSQVKFGLDVYAQFLDDEVGIIVTMPDKSSTIRNYMHIDEVDFLKRKSTYIHELQTHVGVLDLMSIHKSLYTTMCNTFDEDNILCAVLESAMHELFYHGRHVYEKYITIFEHMLHELGIITNTIFKTYDQRVLEWHVKYMDIKLTSSVMDDGQAVVTLAEDAFISDQEGAALLDESAVESEPMKPLTHKWFTNKNDISSEDNTVKPERQMLDSFVEQAGELTEPETSSSTLLQYNVKETYAHKVRSKIDPTFNIIHNQPHDLMDALKRPTPIATLTWPVDGEVTPTNLNLIKEWIISSKFVREKLNNYQYLRGTFCVKVTVNGSAFMYGKSIVAAQYWPAVAGNNDLSFTQITSLPYVSVMPSDGDAGCLSIPILHPHGHLDLNSFCEPIRIIVKTLNPLRTVQNATDPATITIWTWMTDYDLSVPTSAPRAIGWEQSGDEYTKPPASTVATGLSQFIGIARDVPYIGPYARASELALGAFGQIAQLFGFSKPAAIMTPHYIKNKPISDLAHFNGVDTSTKLTLDAKQEVTVDTSVTGFDGTNDMLIDEIAKREAYLTSFSFTTSQSVNNLLWKAVVSPCICARPFSSLVRGNSVFYFSPTPMGHVSLPFQYWRGTLKYRFEIIASPFHKGKIRFVHEPELRYNTDSDWRLDTTIAPSYVVDLSVERQFLMELKWCNNRNYLRTGIPPPFSEDNIWMFETVDLTPLDTSKERYNGFVGVTVVEPLTCSTDDNVFINVYVSAGDDFELQVLSDVNLRTFHTFDTQYLSDNPNRDIGDEQGGVPTTPGVETSAPVNDYTELAIVPTVSNTSLVDHLSQIHYGERVLSLRQVLKRYTPSNILYFPGPMSGINGTHQASWRLNDFPPYSGPDANGMILDVDLNRWNYSTPTNLLNYFTPCFLMRRGSIRNKYLFVDNSPGFYARNWYSISTSRSTDVGYALFQNTIQVNGATPELTAVLNYNSLPHTQMIHGLEMSIPNLKNTVEVELPYYSNKRWHFAQERNINTGFAPSVSQTETDNLRSQTFHLVSGEINIVSGAPAARTTIIRRYTAAGDDYSLNCYLFPPTLVSMLPSEYETST